MSTILEINHIEKSFGGLRAINDFSINLERGKVHGLIGPNGAGKTTIFNLISGIYKPDNGKILLEGKDITRKESHDIVALGISRTFQNIRLFSNLSVLQNVLIADKQDKEYGMVDTIFRTQRFKKTEKKLYEAAVNLLESVGLQDEMNDRSGSLPYGHQRKLEIARAMALQPKILLLDEPAAGMNEEESEELVSFLKKLKGKNDLTILLIEHHMDVVSSFCDSVTVLNFGKTIASGTLEEVRKNPEVITAYLGGDYDSTSE